MSLQIMIDEYGTLKKEANRLYSEYKDLQVVLAQKRLNLQTELQTNGAKSFKTERYYVSTVTKKNIVIENEQSVIDWLKHTPNIEVDAYIGLKTTYFKTMALAMLKDTGELADGTNIEISETITIKGNK